MAHLYPQINNSCAHEWPFISLNCLICYSKWLCSLELIICLHKLTGDRTFVISENMGKQIVIVWRHWSHLLSGENNKKGNVPKPIHLTKTSVHSVTVCGVSFLYSGATKHSPLFERLFWRLLSCVILRTYRLNNVQNITNTWKIYMERYREASLCFVV